MKTKIVSLATLMLLGIFSIQLMAQGGPRANFKNEWNQPAIEKRMERLPDLTEDQKDAMKQIRLETMKKQLPLRNEKDVLKAKLKSQITAESPNLAEINKMIDEIGEIDKQLHKNRIAARLEIRGLLNNEQRIMFDNHFNHWGDRRDMKRPGRPGKGARAHMPKAPLPPAE